MSLAITRAEQAHFPAAQAFYASVGYRAPIQPEDIVVTARDGDRIVGIVRLAREFGFCILRGMMIAPDCQRKGVGSLMLKALEKEIGKEDCLCIPYQHLESFYGQIGFRKIPDSNLPPHLFQRLLDLRKEYPTLISMLRPQKQP